MAWLLQPPEPDIPEVEPESLSIICTDIYIYTYTYTYMYIYIYIYVHIYIYVWYRTPLTYGVVCRLIHRRGCESTSGSPKPRHPAFLASNTGLTHRPAAALVQQSCSVMPKIAPRVGLTFSKRACQDDSKTQVNNLRGTTQNDQTLVPGGRYRTT